MSRRRLLRSLAAPMRARGAFPGRPGHRNGDCLSETLRDARPSEEAHSPESPGTPNDPAAVHPIRLRPITDPMRSPRVRECVLPTARQRDDMIPDERHRMPDQSFRLGIDDPAQIVVDRLPADVARSSRLPEDLPDAIPDLRVALNGHRDHPGPIRLPRGGLPDATRCRSSPVYIPVASLWSLAQYPSASDMYLLRCRTHRVKSPGVFHLIFAAPGPTSQYRRSFAAPWRCPFALSPGPAMIILPRSMRTWYTVTANQEHPGRIPDSRHPAARIQ